MTKLRKKGNKTGNRRTANVRSVGYSDLFCLSKDDLWDALTEYPEAKAKLMQCGQDMLRKDNLLDEEALAGDREKQESLEQRVRRVDESLEQVVTRLARLIGEFGASQAKIKRRLVHLESQSCFQQPPDEFHTAIDIIKDNGFDGAIPLLAPGCVSAPAISVELDSSVFAADNEASCSEAIGSQTSENILTTQDHLTLPDSTAMNTVADMCTIAYETHADPKNLAKANYMLTDHT
ncbi:unnamed protein product, partial [Protopolystoma xenopodis]